MRQFTLPILFLLFISCNRSSNSNKNDFDNYIKNISEIKLPLKINCGLDSASDIKQLERFKDYIPKTAERIYGYISSNESFKLIIYGQVGDDIYPYLYSYDKIGNKIDTLFLILNPCGAADDKMIPHSIAIIDKDLSINLIDTTRFIHYYDNKNYEIDSLRITKVLINMDSNGYFKTISKKIE